MFGTNLISHGPRLSVRLSQNNVRTEACGAERPLRSREEHPAEEADEGRRGRLWIQGVTYVLCASWRLALCCKTSCLRRKWDGSYGV